MNLNYLKEKISTNKSLIAVSTAAMVLSTNIVTHAAGETPTLDIVGPMTTALNSTVTNTIACFSAIIPIGLTIFAAKFAWIKGVQFFSKIAAKG